MCAQEVPGMWECINSLSPGLSIVINDSCNGLLPATGHYICHWWLINFIHAIMDKMMEYFMWDLLNFCIMMQACIGWSSGAYQATRQDTSLCKPMPRCLPGYAFEGDTPYGTGMAVADQGCQICQYFFNWLYWIYGMDLNPGMWIEHICTGLPRGINKH